MRLLSVWACLLFVAVAGCSEPVGPELDTGPLAAASASATASSDPNSYWSGLSDDKLWLHVSGLDSTVSVGLKEPGRARGVDDRGRPLVPRGLWVAFSNQLRNLGIEVLAIDELLPIVTVRVEGPEAIDALRRSPIVEYVEPASFEMSAVVMELGCGETTPAQVGSTVSPGDVVPYSLTKHRVTTAWQFAQGSGIKVAVIDTGVSQYQPQLQQDFATGQSTGRTVTYDYTDANTVSGTPPWHDTCRHGTKSAGLITAPRDGRNIVGVAYKSSLYSVRALDGVDAVGQWAEVREAIRRAASHTEQNAAIVNMAFGTPWPDSGVRSTIQNYYNDSRTRTLFVAAAGNVTGSVVFPANLAEVVAVTGLDPSGNACSICNTGSKVEFGSYTLGQTTGVNEGQIDGLGGSSGGTAVVSGIAALVMSKYGRNRDQAIQRMREAGALWGSKSSLIGYGAIDAAAAVGAIKSVKITGPALVSSSGSYTYTASVTGGNGPFTYSWTPSGGTGSTKSVYFSIGPSSYTSTVAVTVTDQSTGSTAQASFVVLVQGQGCGSEISC